MTSTAFDPALLSPRMRRAYDSLTDEEKRLVERKINVERGYVPPGISLPMLVLLGRLSEREREVWVDSEIVGRSLRQIAVDLGCSHQAVSQIKRNARLKLTRWFGLIQLQSEYVASHPDVKARAARQPSPGR